MDVLILAHTMGTMEATDNDRFTYIIKKLIECGADVELVTSDYEHHKKGYRDKNITSSYPCKVTFLHENAYKRK